MSSRYLCQWRRHDIAGDLKTLHKIIKKPKFICGKCARSAHNENFLCQPLRLKKE